MFKFCIFSDVDEYGFERPRDFDYETYEDFMSEYLKVLAKMARKWAKIIDDKKSPQRNITIKKYVRKGIPGEYRGLVIFFKASFLKLAQMSSNILRKKNKKHTQIWIIGMAFCEWRRRHEKYNPRSL